MSEDLPVFVDVLYDCVLSIYYISVSDGVKVFINLMDSFVMILELEYFGCCLGVVCELIVKCM